MPLGRMILVAATFLITGLVASVFALQEKPVMPSTSAATQQEYLAREWANGQFHHWRNCMLRQ